jgi:heavy-metal exporter, HME family
MSMFNWLVTRSLQNRLLVLSVAALLAAFGMFVLPRLPVDVFPDLNKPTVTIMTEAEGLAPQEVEQLVTFPLETAMNGMPGVTRLRSVSGVGLSFVTVEFEWAADIYRSRQLVAERLSLAAPQMPQGVTPQIGPITSIMGEVMLVALASESISPMELRELADFTVRPQLLAVPGVAQVIPIGGEVRQFRIAPNLVAMQVIDIKAGEIDAAVRRFGQNTGGGYVDQYSREFLIRNVGLTNRLEDLRNLVVATRQGQPISLRQVANVDYAARVKRGDGGYQGKPAVVISILKQPGASTLTLTRQIESTLASLQKTMPPGVTANNIQFRQANFIEASIANVKSALFEATAVVAVVLFLFLLNWRATAISLLAIPVSILVTVAVFKALGMTINTMTLGGLAIAIGELVDDAVVDVENILRRLRENRLLSTPRPVVRVIASASQEVRSGIVYATMIVIFVFVPLFALSGIEGRLFAPLGVAYIVSILASLITSITVTPVLAYYLLGTQASAAHQDNALVRFLKEANRRALTAAFGIPQLVILAAVSAAVVAAISAARLPRTFLPPFNEGTLTISVLYNPGISLKESNRLGLIAERLLMDVPEIASVGRRTGRAELDEHAEGVHSSEIDADLKTSSRSKADIIADIRTRLASLPASINIGQPISHRLDHLLSGVRAEFALKIFGDDLDTLRSLAETLREKLAAVPGLADLQVEKQVPIPQVRIAVDYQKAALYGLTASSVTEALEGLSGGRTVSQIVDGPKRFDVVVRLSDANRSTTGLSDLLISTPGGMIPLRLVAKIEETDGPNQIVREDTRRRIAVLANSDGTADMARIVEDVRGIIGRTQLPQGYSANLEGTFQAQEDAAILIGGLSLLSLVMIFVVLYSRYHSTILAFIVMGNIPLALIGSVIALHIAGQPLSVASMIGFVTLAGISARNGILKISHYLNLSLHEHMAFGRELVIRGSLERLTPVLMTSLAAGLALSPLLLGGGQPGREILHPVAVTIFGGLISAALLDTILTPILFLVFGEAPLERLRMESEASAKGEFEPAAAY